LLNLDCCRRVSNDIWSLFCLSKVVGYLYVVLDHLGIEVESEVFLFLVEFNLIRSWRMVSFSLYVITDFIHIVKHWGNRGHVNGFLVNSLYFVTLVLLIKAKDRNMLTTGYKLLKSCYVRESKRSTWKTDEVIILIVFWFFIKLLFRARLKLAKSTCGGLSLQLILRIILSVKISKLLVWSWLSW
jgi:hypothetical protein